MSDLKQLLDLIPDNTASKILRLLKPRQVREYPDWAKAIVQHLLGTEKDFTHVTAGVKADGHSVMFECHDGNKFCIYSRTDKEKLLLDGEDARRWVTQLACDMRAHLMCELRALFDGKELGFLEVLAMLKRFRDSNMQNVGKFQLLLSPFGVHSVNPEGDTRGCQFLPQEHLDKLLGAFVVSGNPLTRPVESTKFRAQLFDAGQGTHDLEFLTADGRQTVARGSKAFFDYLISLADASGIEGYVLKADPTIFTDKAVVINQYGVRDQSAVKVKREFSVTLMACRVLKKDGKRKQSMIYTYGLAPDGSIVYAGQQTAHVRLAAVLPAAAHAFSFATKDEKVALYTLTKQQCQQRLGHFRMFTASCSNMSKDRCFPIGLKIHDMAIKPVDLSALSILKNVAEGNPHFRSTRAASNQFADAIGRAEKKRAAQKRKSQASLEIHTKRSRSSAPQASLPWDEFMSELGEEFQPPPPVERQASPVPEIVVVEKDQEPETEVMEAEPELPHKVLFADKVGPTQAQLYTRQFAKLGWTIAPGPDPSVTLIAASQAAIDRMPGMCVCTDLKEQCPNAAFIALAALKAKLAAKK